MHNKRLQTNVLQKHWLFDLYIDEMETDLLENFHNSICLHPALILQIIPIDYLLLNHQNFYNHQKVAS